MSSRICGSCLEVVLRFHRHGGVGVFVNSAAARESGLLSLRKEEVKVKTLLKAKCPFVIYLLNHLNFQELSQFLGFL